MFPHLFCRPDQLIHQVLSHAQVKVQPGFFMSLVDRCSYEKIQFCALLYKKLGEPGCSIVRVQFVKEFGIELITEVFFQKFQAPAQGQGLPLLRDRFPRSRP